MTRICQFCKRNYGEKCGNCGSEDVHRLVTVPAADIELWGCMACGNSWVLGEDRPTHGICDACANEIKFQSALAGRDDGGSRAEVDLKPKFLAE